MKRSITLLRERVFLLYMSFFRTKCWETYHIWSQLRDSPVHKLKNTVDPRHRGFLVYGLDYLDEIRLICGKRIGIFSTTCSIFDQM